MALALLVFLPAPSAAAADGPAPRVVVLAPAPGDRISLRVAAELRALGFDAPAPEVAAGPPDRARLEEAARRGGAVAAVRVVASRTGAEVWIVDRLTSKTVLREVVVGDPGSPSADATLALRVVELLRASLMELEAPRPPPGEVAPSPRIRAILGPLSSRPPPREGEPARRAPDAGPSPLVSGELGPALLASPGGLSPSFGLRAAIHLRPEESLGATLLAFLPGNAGHVSGPEGVTAAHIGLAGAGLRGALISAGGSWRARFVPSASVGLAAMWLHLEGTPRPGFAGSTDNLLTAGAWLGAGVSFAVTPWLRARADLLAGAAFLRPVVRFGDRQAAAWGEPFFLPSIGLELVLPRPDGAR